MAWHTFIVLNKMRKRYTALNKKQHVLHFDCMGHKALPMCRLLREEGTRASCVRIHKFYRSTGRQRV